MANPPTGEDLRLLLQRAYVRLRELQAKVDDYKSARSEPLAIIGLGCRFPGGVKDADSYWQLLSQGRDAVTEIPGHRRYHLDATYPSRNSTGAQSALWGGFLEHEGEFDPEFFGITALEAQAMDPQQRLLLEVAWEALEDAGEPISRLKLVQTGVFIGAYNNDYFLLHSGDSSLFNAYTSSGNALSILANRLSYFFDLHGPSLTVDTACSSSLAAVHLACRSLRNGDCDVALAGGVNLILSPVSTDVTSRVLPIAPDGKCKSFDSSANGIVRSEGCGLVVLKRLSDALRNGDTIQALICGTAMNQDGRSNGLTAPNGLSQRAVIRRALADANIQASQVGLIEAHGTGTTLGDPIEIEALQDEYGDGRTSNETCAIGSVKTNLGHLEPAAGIAGLIKVVLSLRHRAIPKHLHFKDLNPNIKLDQQQFFIPLRTVPWTCKQDRYAALSSLGFGGTNVHVICREAPPELTRADEASPAAPLLVLPLSAHSEPALREMAANYVRLLQEGDPTLPEDICYSASVRRNHLPHRLAVVGKSGDSLASRLSAYLNGEKSNSVAVGVKSPSGVEQLVFVFSGQGSQWWAMGRELIQTETVFRDTLVKFDEMFREQSGHLLMESLLADQEQSRLGETSFAQPAIFALQVALVELWRSYGIVPSAVVGHSLGEVAAAYVNGALTAEDAVKVVACRAHAMEGEEFRGRMLEVSLAADEVSNLIASLEGVAIAAFNSLTATVISGDSAVLEELLPLLVERQIPHRYLPGDYAFHSSRMSQYQALKNALSDLAPQVSALPLYSTVTGQKIRGEVLDAHYWNKNMAQPVRFVQVLQALIGDDYHNFLEIGPQPVLAPYILQQLKNLQMPGCVLPSLRRQREQLTVKSSLARLYTLGFPVSWENCYSQRMRQVHLPSYPFQRKRFWIERATPPTASAAGKISLETIEREEVRPASSDPLLAGKRRTTGRSAGSTLRKQLIESDDDQAKRLLLECLRGLVLRVLDRDESEPFDLQQPLADMGMDSLMAVELKNRIENELGVLIPTKVLFEGPSISQLAFELIGQVRVSETGSQAKSFNIRTHQPNGKHTHNRREHFKDDAPRLLASLNQLSNEEVDQLLREFTERSND